MRTTDKETETGEEEVGLCVGRVLVKGTKMMREGKMC